MGVARCENAQSVVDSFFLATSTSGRTYIRSPQALTLSLVVCHLSFSRRIDVSPALLSDLSVATFEEIDHYLHPYDRPHQLLQKICLASGEEYALVVSCIR